MMLKRLMMIMALFGVANVYASEIVHIDKVRQQKLTCQLFSAVVQYGSFEEINDLVAGGADINAHDLFGASLCHHAAVFNRGDAAEILCKNGAHVNAKDCDGNTPLHYACRHGAYEVAEVLLAYGANKWEKNDKKRTPVKYAQKLGRKSIVELIENHHDDTEIKQPEEED